MSEIKVGSLFSGYDGIGLGLKEIWPEAEPVWFCEFDKAPDKILKHHWPGVPNLGDITAVNWGDVPRVDILTGGFPCQDLSHAGRGAGLMSGTRSGLWENMAFAIQQLQPPLVVIENVRGLISAKTAESEEVVGVGPKGGRQVGLTRRALGRVLWDLAYLGYDASWHGVRASDAGAPHQRLRIFILAWPQAASYPDHEGLEGRPLPAQRARELAARAGSVEFGRPAGGVIPPEGLLPTPAVNDMGANKTIEWWEEWAPRQMSSDGRSAPHGRSLAIELMKTAPALDGEVSSAPGPGPDYGVYEAAVRRWEPIIGRLAPPPTERNKDGRAQLSPKFTEWMMGLPEGHVTDPRIGLTRTQQLKACGNGVVPLQAARAVRGLVSTISLEFEPVLGRKFASTPEIRGLVLLEILEPARYEKALDALVSGNPWVWNQLRDYGIDCDLAIQGLELLQLLEPARVPAAISAMRSGHPGVRDQLVGYRDLHMSEDAATLLT